VHQGLSYCANLGDCRAVAAVQGGGDPCRWSVDHRPDVPEEQARITAAGGFVQDGRLMGNVGRDLVFMLSHANGQASSASRVALGTLHSRCVPPKPLARGSSSWQPYLSAEPALAPPLDLSTHEFLVTVWCIPWRMCTLHARMLTLWRRRATGFGMSATMRRRWPRLAQCSCAGPRGLPMLASHTHAYMQGTWAGSGGAGPGRPGCRRGQRRRHNRCRYRFEKNE
jgi:hypothetical protein